MRAMTTRLTRRGLLTGAAAAGVGMGLRAVAGEANPGGALRWKAGLAKARITPGKPLWMGGFAGRKKPSEGTMLELYAKALALEDQTGKRAVLLTSDLVGFPPAVAKEIAGQAEKKYGLPRDRLVLSASHTHSGPMLHDPQVLWYLDLVKPRQAHDAEDYTCELIAKIVAVIGDALADLRPARLAFANGRADFAVNRRRNTPKGVISFVPNPDGPVDRDVPLLRVEGPDGRPRAAVFGYAAHTSCLQGDNFRFSGDYAGFAQQRLEQQHPGMMALFVQGCGGDIMVSPRGTEELARKYGDQLAAAVDQAARGALAPVRGPLKTAIDFVPLTFAPGPGRKELEARLNGAESAESRRQKEFLGIADVDWRRHARESLKLLDRGGRLPAAYPCPLQVWQFGGDLALIALGGEAVVDYSLRLKKELGPGRLWVAAYANDAFAYIPSRRVLEEGGYEGGGAAIGSLLPGAFAPTAEETIVGKVHELVKRVRAN